MATVLRGLSTGLLEGDRIHDLVERSVQGDAEAFGELYERYFGDIYRYLYRHIGDAPEAEDLAESTFLKAWQNIGRYEWQGKPFTSWLYTIARNQMIDSFRKKKNNALLDERQPSYDAAPDDLAIRQETYADIRHALDYLTPMQRRLILLKFYQEKDNREIALLMGKTATTVRSIQMRALAALRRRLATQALAAT